MAKVVLPLQGVFDTDTGRLAGVTMEGVSDVSYFGTADTPDGAGLLTQPEVLAVRNGVGKNVGNITDAQTLTMPGASIGERRTLTTGDSAGAELVWAVPAGQSTAVWCWAIFPTAAYN
jgi:hypothetical protein